LSDKLTTIISVSHWRSLTNSCFITSPKFYILMSPHSHSDLCYHRSV